MAKQSQPSRRKATATKIRAKAWKPNAVQPKPTTKIDLMVAALRAPKGVSIKRLMDITGWQMHSVRGALAGPLKKKRGLTVSSTKVKDERVYRIEGGK